MKNKIEGRVSIQNRQARFEYEILESFVAGIVLKGTEIKSIRQSQVQMSDAYCQFREGELYIVNLYIAPYEKGTYNNHNPRQDRKLLLKKVELNKLVKKAEEKGMTMIPLRLFINEKGYAKLDFGLGRGKKLYDKREDIKARDVKRDLERER